MRILQVSPFFSPRLGGSPQVVYQISRELSQRGHDITVLAGDFGIKQAAFPKQAFNTVMLRSVVSRWGFYFTPDIMRWCRAYLREFDIIHLHEVRTFQNMIVHGYAKRYKIPYVLSAHGTLPVIVQRKLAKRVYDFLFGQDIMKSACRLIAVSPFEEGWYRQFGIERERIHTIFNGLDLQEYSNIPARGEFRRELGLDDKVKIVLYLGRLHQRKGIDILIKAFSQLRNELEDVHLIVAGPDDGELSHLQSLVNVYRVDNHIRFVGPLYGREKLVAYVDGDILAYPGVFEIFGLVPFEALLCGTPVVVANDCGLGELMREAGAGYTVPYGDEGALAKCIGQVLENPEEAQQRVRRGQEFIRARLDWKQNVSELEALYGGCIRGNEPGG